MFCTVMIHNLKPLGLLKFQCHFWVPWRIYFKMHRGLQYLKKMLIICRWHTKHVKFRVQYSIQDVSNIKVMKFTWPRSLFAYVRNSTLSTQKNKKSDSFPENLTIVSNIYDFMEPFMISVDTHLYLELITFRVRVTTCKWKWYIQLFSYSSAFN